MSAHARPDPPPRVLELLRRHGRNTCSFQALELGLHYWFDGDDACVAYADTGGAWIAAGDPIAPPERMDEVLVAFCRAARDAGRRPRFFAMEGEPGPRAKLRTTPIGTQPIWDPRAWPETLRRKRSLREQLRRARAKGVTVREVGADELEPGHPTRACVDALIAHWLDSRAIAPMGFLVEIDVYHTPQERRFLVAERHGAVVGILVAVPVYARDGWFFEDVLRDPAAPNGTIELLFDFAMRACADAGSTHVTFGLAPLADVPSRTLAWIRDRSRIFYDFEGLRRFKSKLEPQCWEPVYLGYPERERGIVAVIDSLEAFARGSFWRFGWATLVHRARRVTGLLALLLIPWTIALARFPAQQFPSRRIQLAWVVYDVILLALLGVLLKRWRPGLAATISVLAGIDATLGTVQLAVHNVHHVDGIVAFGGMLAALLAPVFASTFLWKARHRYRHQAPSGSAFDTR